VQFVYSWGILLQAVAIVHFIRRRPDGFWLWIIIFGGGFGAIVYIAVEALPDVGLLRQSFKVFPRRRRIRELEAVIQDNPSAGNYEELADLYMEEGNFARARSCYTHSISSRTDSPDPFYRRGICEIQLQEFPAAVDDLERVVARDRKYDFYRAAGLLAHAYANNLKRRISYFGKSQRPLRSLKLTTTTHCFLLRNNGSVRHATGCARYLRRNPLCQVIFGAGSVPGFVKRVLC
jgi:hypothetical protein